MWYLNFVQRKAILILSQSASTSHHYWSNSASKGSYLSVYTLCFSQYDADFIRL